MIVSYFILIGLEMGERMIYVDGDEDHSNIIEALRKLSVDVDSVTASGQLSILDRKQTYLAGEFDSGRMINYWKDSYESAMKNNFPGLRVAGDVPCEEEDGSLIDKIVEYEVKLNPLFSKNNILALCLYNRSLLSDTAVHNILRAHPAVIHRNTVCRNYEYVPPEEWRDAPPMKQDVDSLLEEILARSKNANKNS